jgi:hypothetical protein
VARTAWRRPTASRAIDSVGGGRAADLYKLGGNNLPYWSEEEFLEMKALGDAVFPAPTESFDYYEYPDHHYHIEYDF